MNKVLTMIIALLIPVLSFGQQIDGFNSVPDTSYWDYEISASADSTLSFINALSLIHISEPTRPY